VQGGLWAPGPSSTARGVRGQYAGPVDGLTKHEPTRWRRAGAAAGARGRQRGLKPHPSSRQAAKGPARTLETTGGRRRSLPRLYLNNSALKGNPRIRRPTVHLGRVVFRSVTRRQSAQGRAVLLTCSDGGLGRVQGPPSSPACPRFSEGRQADLADSQAGEDADCSRPRTEARTFVRRERRSCQTTVPPRSQGLFLFYRGPTDAALIVMRWRAEFVFRGRRGCSPLRNSPIDCHRHYVRCHLPRRGIR